METKAAEVSGRLRNYFMKKSLIIGIVALIVGGTLGWQVSSFRDYAQFGKTLQLIKEGGLVEKLDQSDSAYFLQKWEIAAWELENVNKTLGNYLASHILDEKFLRYKTFVVNARLAKVYAELGNKDKSDEQVLISIDSMKKAQFNPEPVTNSVSLFGVLDKIDQLEIRKKSGHLNKTQ